MNEPRDRKSLVLGKHCKVDFKDNFVLEGEVLDVDDYGFVLETTQRTSYIAWTAIKTIYPVFHI